MKVLSFLCVIFLILPFVYGIRDTKNPKSPIKTPGKLGDACLNVYRFERYVAPRESYSLKKRRGTCGRDLCCSFETCGPCPVSMDRLYYGIKRGGIKY